MTDENIMKLALDALNSGVDVQMGRVVWTEYDSGLIAKAVTALTDRLAQPEQEPVPTECRRDGRCQHVIDLGIEGQSLGFPLVKPAQQERDLIRRMQGQIERLQAALDTLPDRGLSAMAAAKSQPAPQPEQEPVAYPDGDVVGPCICGSWPGGKCLKCPRITTPPQRKPLSDEEVGEIYYGITRQRSSISGSWIKTFARAIEAAHNIKE